MKKIFLQSAFFCASVISLVSVNTEGAAYKAPNGITADLSAVKVLPGAPDGGELFRFNGDKKGAVWNGELNSGDAAVSLFFCPEKEKDNGIVGLGFTTCTYFGMKYGKGPSVSLPLEDIPGIGVQRLTGVADYPIDAGEWHHLAWIYSSTGIYFRVWLDGREQFSKIPKGFVKAEVKTLPPLGVGYRGDIGGIRIYDYLPPESELLSVNGEPVIEWFQKETRNRRKPLVDSWKKVLGNGWRAPIPLQIDPYYNDKRLPYMVPADGKATKTISMAAALGEYESASFMLYPETEIKEFHLVPSDLRLAGDAKAVIKAADIDISVVKAWHAPAGSWIGVFIGEARPELIPELILHDDSLVRVDHLRRTNELRIDYPDGARYVDIIGEDEDFDPFVEPVRDAKTLCPLDLPKEEFKQFWLTVKVPEDVKAGTYTGTVKMTVKGDEVGTLSIELRVHPFKLPLPRTRYDISKEYITSIMYGSKLPRMVNTARSLPAAEKRFKAICESFASHNFLNADGPGDFAADDPDDYALRGLKIMQMAGLSCRPLFNGDAAPAGWLAAFSNRQIKGADLTPEKQPKFFKEQMDAHKAATDRDIAILKKYLGHTECYFYGYDEAGLWGERQQLPFWRYLHEQGGRTVTTGGDPTLSYVGDLNDHALNIVEERSRAWHGGGARATVYAAPYIGPENPYVARRNRGLRNWFANFDGIYDVFLDEWRGNPWNEFFKRGQQFRHLCCVYPTQDGIISTLAWEGMREAIDDVRYITLLRLAAEEAFKSGDKKRIDVAREALVYLEGKDPETIFDIDAFRIFCVDAIERMGVPKLPDSYYPSVADTGALPTIEAGPGPSPSAEYQKIVNLRKAMGIYEKTPSREACRNLIAAYNDLSRNNDAMPVWQKLITYGDENDKLDYAEFLLTIRRRDEAVALLEGLTRGKSVKATAKIHLRIAEARLSHIYYAEKVSKEAIEAARDDIEKVAKARALPAKELCDAYMKLHEVMVDRGMIKESKDLITKSVLSLAGLPEVSRAGALMALGDDLTVLGRKKEALKNYEEALQTGADSHKCNEKIAWLAVDVEDFNRAQIAFADWFKFCRPDGDEVEYSIVSEMLKRFTEAARKKTVITPTFEEEEFIIDL